MKNCKYYLALDGHLVILNNDQELTEYISDNMEVNEQTSALEIKHSFMLTKGQKETKDALGKIPAYDRAEKTPYDFIRELHMIKGQEQLLVPSFIEENYRKELSSIVSRELGNPDLKSAVVQNEVSRRLAINKEMESLSILLSRVFTERVNYKLGKPSFSKDKLELAAKAILTHNNKTLKVTDPITQVEIDDFSKKILERIDVAVEELRNRGGILLINQSLSVLDINTNDAVRMSSAAHAMSIDEEGVPHLFEVKVSERKFSNWDPVKVRTAEYILGIKRQLLSNYVDTSRSTLNIINIIVPLNDNGTFNINNITVNSDIELSKRKEGLNKNNTNDPLFVVDSLNNIKGPITTLLRTLLPATLPINKVISTTLVEDTANVLNLAFPKYQLRTKLSVNPDEFIKKTLERFTNSKEVYFYDRLSTHNQKITFSKSDPNWKDDFKTAVTEYLVRWNEDKDSRMLTLVEEIRRVKLTKDKLWKDTYNGDERVIEKSISRYLQPEWIMMNNTMKELNELGILLFYNNKTNIVEAIAVTNNSLDNVHNLTNGNSLLGKFKTNRQVQGKNILDATGSNIEAIKVLATLNNLKEVLNGKSLGGIHVLHISPFVDKSQIVLLPQITKNFTELLAEASKIAPAPIEDNFKSQKIKLADPFLNLYHQIVLNPFLGTNISTSVNKLTTIIQENDFTSLPDDDNAKLQWFTKLRTAMLAENIGLEKNMKGEANMEDPVHMIYDLVVQGINYYKELINIFDYSTPKVGMRAGDALHFFKSALFGYAPEYDEQGNKIVGILQGSQFSTSDALQSTALSNMHNLVAIASSRIATEFQKEQVKISTATGNYYDAIGRSDLQRVVIGNANAYHKVFFETGADDEITSDFKFKNPWNPNSNLNNVQRDYLKIMLFSLFKNSSMNVHGVTTMEEFEKSAEFFDVSNGMSNLFYAPLVKNSNASKWIPSFKDFHKFAGRIFDSIKDGLDPKAQTEEERVRNFNSLNEFKKIHNQYELGSDLTFRESLLEKYGVEHFELNLDTIATKYILEHIRSKFMNIILEDIHSGLSMIKYHGWKTGRTKELIEALDTFWDQIKISVYNTSVIEGEGTDAIILVKKAQKIASLMTIALRPMLMAKELTVGLFKNVSLAMYKTYGDDAFGEADLMFGYMSILDPSKETYILNSVLNRTYRIANSDLNQLATRTKFDRQGLEFLSERMYWFSTAPDYINRMSWFLAKMKHDGCYDAHSIGVDGELVYNPMKDKRYEHYLKNRDIYKIDGKYHFSPNDVEFNTQRSLYLSVMDDFNAGFISTGEELLVEENHLPQAYSFKQRASIKNFTDTIYGHYDHDTTPMVFHGAIGILFGQFLRFFPDKVKYYVGKPVKNTVRGSMGQKFNLKEDGTKELLWRKEEEVGDGDIVISEVPESELSVSDPRVQATGWNGDMTEGIFYSLSASVHDLVNGKLDTSDPQQLKRAKLAIHDILASFIFIWLGSLMMNDKKAWKDKSESEKNLAKLGMKSMGELNVFASLFGSLSATPSFIKILGETTADIQKFMNGDLAVGKLLKDNVRMLELLPMSTKLA